MAEKNPLNPVKNADEAKFSRPKFILVGSTGSGKTAQLLTMPGRKFVYVFDPNTENTYAYYHSKGASLKSLDYMTFFPELLDMNVVSLKSNVRDFTGRPDEPRTYVEWEKDFEDRYRSGFFNDYDIVGIDSMTTFQDIIMDRVLFKNGRLGKQPEQPDWASQIATVKNTFRVLTSPATIPGRNGNGVMLFATAHHDLKQDDLSKRIQYQILLTGKLRQRLPLLFSDIYILSTDIVDKEPGYKYEAQTRPTPQHPTARCTMGLNTFEDMTILDAKNPEKYGLGRILNERGGVYTVIDEKLKKVVDMSPGNVTKI